MKPCEVCGKIIKKKDSVLTHLYVCSKLCQQNRKNKMPKKKTPVTVAYWIEQGFSLEEARIKISNVQKQRSKRSVDYWVSRGFDEDQAKTQVKLFQSSNGKQNVQKYSREERQIRTPFSKLYWTNKGFTEHEASEIIQKNSDGTSLQYFQKRFGLDRGLELYSEMCNLRKRKYCLDAYISKYGEIQGKSLWSKKYKNRHNSKKACDFFDKLINTIGDRYKIYCAQTELGEYGVYDHNSHVYYFYDFVIPELKICVEFNGDYWHCNPKKYDALFEHRQSGLTAKEIWEKDKVKHDCLIKERGIDILVVWESDDLENKIKEIMEKINVRASSNQK